MINILCPFRKGTLYWQTINICLGSAHHFLPGAITPYFDSKNGVEDFIQMVSENGTLDNSKLVEQKIDDPLLFMKEASGHGICGIQNDDKGDSSKCLFIFTNRIEEAGWEFPTVLMEYSDSEDLNCLTRVGIKRFKQVDLRYWDRYDVLDHTLAKFGKKCPFRNWEQGDPLYEVSCSEGFQTVAEVSILEEYNSPEGAYPFFTNIENAKCFLDRINNISGAEFSREEVSYQKKVFNLPLEVREVKDLRERLTQLDEYWFLKIAINPFQHRENSAWGFLHSNGPTGDEDIDKTIRALNDKGSYWIRSVSGIWVINSKNQFSLIDRYTKWNGCDKFFKNSGPDHQFAPLKRTLQRIDDDHYPIFIREISDVELDETLEEYLISDGAEKMLENMDVCFDNEDSFDKYVISSWDTVTGDGGTWTFSSSLEAIKFLVYFEKEHDQPHRINGVMSCKHVGFGGSGDSEQEIIVGKKITKALNRIAPKNLKDRIFS